VFQTITLRGSAAALMLGYKDAVVLKSWAITKTDGQWTLRATVARVDPYLSRQRPLLFTAPRPGGFWAWGVESVDVGTSSLVAKLGPPER
jgi:hypothetical protein